MQYERNPPCVFEICSRNESLPDIIHIKVNCDRWSAMCTCRLTRCDPVKLACSSYYDWNTPAKSRDIKSDIAPIYQFNIWFIRIRNILTIFWHQQCAFCHTAFKFCWYVLYHHHGMLNLDSASVITTLNTCVKLIGITAKHNLTVWAVIGTY